jgi:hypothetical protein
VIGKSTLIALKSSRPNVVVNVDLPRRKNRPALIRARDEVIEEQASPIQA